MPSVTSQAAISAAKVLRYKKWSNRLYSRMMDLYEKNPLNRRYERIQRRLRRFPKKVKGETIVYRNISNRKCGFLLSTETNQKLLIFLHGGAYVIGPGNYSWTFLKKVCHSMNWNGVLPDYPKAPEWDYSRTQDYMEEFYREILREYSPKDILLAGSSAGAGLAISSIHRWNEKNLPLPSKLILISPWLDLALDHPQIKELEELDITLSRDVLLQAARLYRGTMDSLDPKISPLYGDLSILPPTMILTGSKELFLHHCRELRDGIQEKGGDVEYIEEEGLFHSWPIMHQLPESELVRAKMIQFLRE